MYAIVRHPMYAGLILGSVGLAAISLSEARLALTVLLWWILEQKVRTTCMPSAIRLLYIKSMMYVALDSAPWSGSWSI